MKHDLSKIQRLVGDVTAEQLRYVDCFVGEDVGLFMPVGGPCYYGILPNHTHPAYMFTLPFNDQTLVDIGGNKIQARHGMIFALSPGIVHHELPSDYPPRYIAIFITKKFFEDQIFQYPAGGGICFNGDLYTASPALLPLLKRFMIEADIRISGTKAVLNAISIEISHTIIRGILGINQNDNISSRVEIDRVIEHIHSHIDEKLTVEDMADVAGMSPSSFSRTFKKEVGIPPAEYLIQIRLDRAKKMLIAGDKSVTEIALECGFNSPAYLSASFHKRFNLTPSKYLNGSSEDRISKEID